MIPIPILSALVGAVLAFAGAWGIQANRYDLKIETMLRQQAEAHTKALQDARDETARLQAQADDAQRKASLRQAALARDAAGSRDALVSLYSAADSALRDSQNSHEACKLVAATGTELLKQCSSRYQTVAEEADRWAGEALTLRDAWPKQLSSTR